MPADAEIRPIRLTNNAVFEVRAGRAVRLALRIHRPRYRLAVHTRSELTFLQALGKQLEGTRITVPQPIPTRAGELVSRIDGARHASLLSWIDGRELKPTRGLGRRSTFLLGEALGRIHHAAERLERPCELKLPRWDADAMFTSASPFRPGPMEEFLPAEAWQLFQGVAERTRAALAQLDRTDGSWGVVHEDFILINCRFARSSDGWRLGVIDFDDLGWGYYLCDLASLLGNLADFENTYLALRRAFLAGYRSVRPLPASLEVHLPILMAARHAVSLTWLAGMHSRGETDLPIEQHVEYRVAAMRQCLGM